MNGHTVFVIRGVVLLLVAAALGSWLVLGHGSQAQPASTLAISMTDFPDPVEPDGVVTYTITVENTGTTDEHNVIVDDRLSGPATIVSANPSQGFCNHTTMTAGCWLGTVAPDAVATIIIEKVVPIGGTGEILVHGSDSSLRPADGSGSSSPPYAAIAGGAAAAALALVAGSWYTRRRWLR